MVELPGSSNSVIPLGLYNLSHSRMKTAAQQLDFLEQYSKPMTGA